MSDDPHPQNDSRYFRQAIGLLCVLGSLVGFFALYFVPIPPENNDAMMLALGLVFGWGASVVGSEYGATTTGRKVAESAIRKIERQDMAGASDAVQDVNVVNAPDEPVPVKEKP